MRVAGVVAGFVGGPVVGGLVVGSFAALFVVALTIMLVRGIRGVEAGRRAYLATFGWSQWFQGIPEAHDAGPGVATTFPWGRRGFGPGGSAPAVRGRFGVCAAIRASPVDER